MNLLTKMLVDKADKFLSENITHDIGVRSYELAEHLCIRKLGLLFVNESDFVAELVLGRNGGFFRLQ